MRKLTILIVVILLATILGGCKSDSNLNKYSGIDVNDISGLNDLTKFDFVYIYKGTSDNWAATYYIYRLKGEQNHVSRLLAKYIGDEPTPTGDLTYSYRTEGSGGRGSLPAEPKMRIYKLGQSGGNGFLPGKNAIVSFTINWNSKTESIELKSADK